MVNSFESRTAGIVWLLLWCVYRWSKVKGTRRGQVAFPLKTQVLQGAKTTESYTYDSVGNRLSAIGFSPLSYNSANELVSSPSSSFTYDKNGNMLSKATTAGAINYSWDFENRLTSAAVPAANNITSTINFVYDPFGRRVKKSSPSGETIYLYDGANVISELSASGTVVASYTQGSGIDEPLAMQRGGYVNYFHADGLGSVTSLTNTAGHTVSTYAYHAFGGTTATEGIYNPFRYTGREQDTETGLYYYRARYYDPTIGRFISEDPLGFDGGDVNYYAYVHNNPINLWDAFGLSSLVFNRGNGTITVVDGNGNVVGTYPAANNAQTGSRGPWDPGTYDYGYHTTHPGDSPDSPYGSNGNFVFNVPGCTGCGVHSGRVNTPDRRGRRGPQHATNGCIRTTDDATSQINNLTSHGDPLRTLTVQ